MTAQFVFDKIRKTLESPDFKKIYLPFVWHGFFLALTMSMIEFNTILPTLISKLTSNTLWFGGIYSILLGAPLIFNMIFSRYQQKFAYRKKFLLIGIYARSISFIGMAAATFFLAGNHPSVALVSFYFLILLFSLGGGFAGIAYTGMIGDLLPSNKRGGLYAARQFAGGIASILGGFLIVLVFQSWKLSFPYNYAVILLVGSAGLIAGSAGFWMIREPRRKQLKNRKEADTGLFKTVLHTLRTDRSFLRFIIIENMSSFSLMILPFYIVFIKGQFRNFQDYLGVFIISQILGGIFSNFLWAFVSKRYGPAVTVRTCILIGAMIPVIALLIRPLGILSYVLVFLLIGMVMSGRNVGFEPYLLDIAPEEKRTAYLGIRGSLNIMVVLLPLAGGLFIQLFGYTVAFLIVFFVMLLAFVFIKKQGRSTPDRRSLI